MNNSNLIKVYVVYFLGKYNESIVRLKHFPHQLKVQVESFKYQFQNFV